MRIERHIKLVTQVRSYATSIPLVVWIFTNSVLFGLMRSSPTPESSWEDVRFWSMVGAGILLCWLIHRVILGLLELKLGSETVVSRSVEDRLDELERLKRRDMVTPEEYAAKRQEILKDL